MHMATALILLIARASDHNGLALLEVARRNQTQGPGGQQIVLSAPKNQPLKFGFY